ncbi:hypothetical protein [Chitinibacter tainanensis]|uniref:hypothetical protein n=1 Tax=Chitinibacter tainanensis TaxID=230667 RepID=UPI0004244F2D|nr:hypothetical protein [Chitinibacter tainanensis]
MPEQNPPADDSVNPLFNKMDALMARHRHGAAPQQDDIPVLTEVARAPQPVSDDDIPALTEVVELDLADKIAHLEREWVHDHREPDISHLDAEIPLVASKAKPSLDIEPLPFRPNPARAEAQANAPVPAEPAVAPAEQAKPATAPASPTRPETAARWPRIETPSPKSSAPSFTIPSAPTATAANHSAPQFLDLPLLDLTALNEPPRELLDLPELAIHTPRDPEALVEPEFIATDLVLPLDELPTLSVAEPVTIGDFQQVLAQTSAAAAEIPQLDLDALLQPLDSNPELQDDTTLSVADTEIALAPEQSEVIEVAPPATLTEPPVVSSLHAEPLHAEPLHAEPQPSAAQPDLVSSSDFSLPATSNLASELAPTLVTEDELSISLGDEIHLTIADLAPAAPVLTEWAAPALEAKALSLNDTPLEQNSTNTGMVAGLASKPAASAGAETPDALADGTHRIASPLAAPEQPAASAAGAMEWAAVPDLPPAASVSFETSKTPQPNTTPSSASLHWDDEEELVLYAAPAAPQAHIDLDASEPSLSFIEPAMRPPAAAPTLAEASTESTSSAPLPATAETASPTPELPPQTLATAGSAPEPQPVGHDTPASIATAALPDEPSEAIPPTLNQHAIDDITAMVGAQLAIDIASEVEQLAKQHFSTLMNQLYEETLRKLTTQISLDLEAQLAPRISELVQAELRSKGLL